MTDMIEKVALAIMDAAKITPSRDQLDDPNDPIEGYGLMAKAAIAAMREPTEAMAKAMLWAGVTHGEDKTEWRCFEDAWQAGIDAALEGKDD